MKKKEPKKKQLEQKESKPKSERHLLLRVSSTLILLFVVGASFAPVITNFHRTGGGSFTVYVQKVEQWSIWQAAITGFNARHISSGDSLSLRVLAWICLLGITLMLIGWLGVFGKRRGKLRIVAMVGSVIVGISAAVTGMVLQSGNVQSGPSVSSYQYLADIGILLLLIGSFLFFHLARATRRQW
jgi:hypothetical protein